MIFSAVEPKAIGRHPDMPCVEITTMSIWDCSMTLMILPARSLPASILDEALIPLEQRVLVHLVSLDLMSSLASCRTEVSGKKSEPLKSGVVGMICNKVSSA
jgi:hypothetical protein